MRLLRIAAAAELSTLLVLLANLLTVHAKAITTLCGPLHGVSYVAVIAATSLASSTAPNGALWRAFIPGIGGLLAQRALGVRRG
ncbi:hypothetical protein [Nonomuraea sp. NPDC050786]|uniref:hypothetical protein n=1 Tax=Nonomuraea sp. NPDC050786 TaxID=3154840 RepID=UPI0033E16EE2